MISHSFGYVFSTEARDKKISRLHFHRVGFFSAAENFLSVFFRVVFFSAALKCNFLCEKGPSFFFSETPTKSHGNRVILPPLPSSAHFPHFFQFSRPCFNGCYIRARWLLTRTNFVQWPAAGHYKKNKVVHLSL